MTKLFGSLVGTPINNLQQTGFGAVSNRYKDGHDEVMVRDTITLAGALIADQVSLGIFRSNAYIDHGNSFLWFGACGAGCTLNIGDVLHPNTLANALAVAAVGVSSIEPLWTPAWMAWPLWQRLGYASDPGSTLELLATFAGAAPANVPLAWQICGRRN